MAGPGALEQIIDNYVDNALEVAPAGTTVQLVVVAVEQTVEVHVVDQGAASPTNSAATPSTASGGRPTPRRAAPAWVSPSWPSWPRPPVVVPRCGGAGGGVDAMVRLPRR